MLDRSYKAETDGKSISGLLSDALDQFSKLIRSEIALARAEFVDRTTSVARSSAMIVAGTILLVPSLGILLLALGTWMIEAGMRASLSYFISGVLGLLLASVLSWIGVGRLKAQTLVPRRTLGQLRQDVRTVKEHL